MDKTIRLVLTNSYEGEYYAFFGRHKYIDQLKKLVNDKFHELRAEPGTATLMAKTEKGKWVVRDLYDNVLLRG